MFFPLFFFLFFSPTLPFLLCSRYQMQTLLHHCGEILLQTLAVDNALERYVLADVCDYSLLKNACLSMITRDSGQLQVFKAQPQFCKLSHSQLMLIIDAMTPLGKSKRKQPPGADDDELTPTLCSSSTGDKLTANPELKRARISTVVPT